MIFFHKYYIVKEGDLNIEQKHVEIILFVKRQFWREILVKYEMELFLDFSCSN